MYEVAFFDVSGTRDASEVFQSDCLCVARAIGDTIPSRMRQTPIERGRTRFISRPGENEEYQSSRPVERLPTQLCILQVVKVTHAVCSTRGPACRRLEAWWTELRARGRFFASYQPHLRVSVGDPDLIAPPTSSLCIWPLEICLAVFDPPFALLHHLEVVNPPALESLEPNVGDHGCVVCAQRGWGKMERDRSTWRELIQF